MERITRFQKLRFFEQTDGVVAPIVATAIVTLIVMMGGAIEVSRAYMVKDRLQAACDAAVLVGRKSVGENGFDSDALTQAKQYFAANFDEASQGASGTVFSAASPDNGRSVEGKASTLLSTVVMQAFGKKSVSLSVDCSAAMGVGNIDVTMVLDTTGSMAGARIAGLQSAMISFYDTVKTATAGTSARVRYAFVPYSSSVNVGRLLYDINPDFLVDRRTIQSKVPVYKTIQVKERIGWKDPVITTDQVPGPPDPVDSTIRWSSTKYRSSKECQKALPTDGAWVKAGDTSFATDQTINSLGQQVLTKSIIQPQTSRQYDCIADKGLYAIAYYIHTWVGTRDFYYNTIETSDPIYKTVENKEFAGFEYRAHEWDTSKYKTFATVPVPLGEGGADVATQWNGCIEERATVRAGVFEYVPLWGITPLDAFDLNIDLVPDKNKPETQWAPAWKEVSHYRLTNTGQLTSDQVSAYGKKSNHYCPVGAEPLQEWSKGAFDGYAKSLTPAGNTYHDLGMLWGARLSSPDGIFAGTVNAAPANGGEVSRHIIFMTDGMMEPNNLIYSAYGIEYLDHRIIGDGSTQPLYHAVRFRAVCEAVKAKGIRIWIIAFGTDLTFSLDRCASDNSSFVAKSTAELTEAFTQIARQVGELRIVK